MIVKLPLRFPISTIIIVGLITALFLCQLPTLKPDNSPEIWYSPGDPTLQQYQQFKQTFGSDLLIYIIYKSDNLFNPESLDLNRELTSALAKIDQVSRVTSLTNVNTFRKGSLSATIPLPLINRNNTGLEQARQRAMEDELLRDNVISHDGKSTTIKIDLTSDKMATNIKVLREVEKVLAQPEFSRTQYYIMGNIPIIAELNRISNSESRRFIAASILAIFLLLLVVFRRARMAILPLTVACVSVIWSMGVYAIAGNTLNMITAIMPLIILVVSIAHSIHIISHYDRKAVHPGSDKEKALEMVMDNLLNPCLFTCLTTIAAFLAFNASSILPIKKLGIYTSIGVFIPFLLSFTLLPAILSMQKKSEKRTGTSAVLRRIEVLLSSSMAKITNHRKAIILSFSLAIIIFTPGLSLIGFQTDQVEYLKENNPVRIANIKMRLWYEGVYPVEVVLDSIRPGFFHTSEGLALIREVESHADKEPEIRKTLSPYKIFESYYFTNTGLKGENVVFDERHDKEIKAIFTHPSGVTNEFISPDGSKARISMRSVWLDNQGVEELIEKVRASTAGILAAKNIDVHFTGTPAMYVKLNQNIIRSQLFSFLLSFLAIFFILRFLFGSFQMAIIGMIPNIFPVFISLGVIGWFGVKMDVATVLIAAITLGIAVDDTIHFLCSYRENASNLHNREQILSLVLDSVGQPIVLTTLLLICGFSVMIFSSFLPIIYFGIFIVLNVIMALVADLVLLPAILLVISEKENNHG